MLTKECRMSPTSSAAAGDSRHPPRGQSQQIHGHPTTITIP